VATLLPVLKEFVFSATGGTIGTGVLETPFVLLGGISLPAGAKINIIKDALLVNTQENVISANVAVKPMKSIDASWVFIPFDSQPDIVTKTDSIDPQELSTEQFQIEILTDNQFVSNGRSINSIIIDALGGANALSTLTPQKLTDAFNAVSSNYLPNNKLLNADLSCLKANPEIKKLLGIISKGPGGTALTWYDPSALKTILKALYPKTFSSSVGRPGCFSVFQGTVSNEFVKRATGELLTTAVVTNDILAETFTWFRANPPAGDGSNFEARRAHSVILDQLGFDIPVDAWNQYRRTKDPTLERQYPILSYLRIAEQRTLEEIRTTTVTSGVRIWKLYNMGMIVKTPDKCFAIDLIPGAIDFSGVLDFAIASHWHGDHVDEVFFNKMKSLNKKIFVAQELPWIKSTAGLTKITENTVIKIGELSISFIVSAQTGGAYAPCLITTIDCGPATGNFTIMHIGDANKPEEYPKGLNVDYLEYHGEGGYEEATSIIQPRLINIGHILELAHNGLWGTGIDGKGGYTGAYKVLPNNGMLTAEATAMVLTWGESLLFAPKK